MKQIIMISLMCLISTYVFSIQEKDIFPENKSEYIPALVWYSKLGKMYVNFGSNIIEIDAWHYPAIDDDEEWD